MALLLCDIDGTLVRGGSSYDSTMEQAINQVFRKHAPVDLSRFHGYTDRLVMKQVLTENHILFDNQSIERCLYVFGEIFPEDPSDIEIIPGVLETIPLLPEENTLGLLTGNVEAMARKKLRKFPVNGSTLNDYFPFGGFGGTDQHESRADLIHIAIERAGNFKWDRRRRIYVIDDSQRGIGAVCEAKRQVFLNYPETRLVPIGITTGLYSREQLRESGAEYIVDNFKEIPSLIEN